MNEKNTVATKIKEVQTEHSERMRAMQDQIDVLSAKLDSFTTQPEH